MTAYRYPNERLILALTVFLVFAVIAVILFFKPGGLFGKAHQISL